MASALDGGEWSASRPTGSASEPVWTLWRIEKYLAHMGNQTPPAQPLDRRYTAWAA
jgi:hypothetical protein